MKKADAAISISGIKISSMELFQEYFDFEEVYGIIKEDTFLYESFLKSAFPPHIRIIFFGLKEADGSAREESAAHLIKEPEKCIQYYPLYFRDAGQDSLVCVQEEELSSYIGSLYESVWTNLPAYVQRPDTETFRESTDKFLKDVTNRGKRRFTCEGAAALLIYLLLHIQACRLPDQPSSCGKLTSMLKDIYPMEMRTEKHIEIKEKSKSVEIGRLYQGGGCEEGTIEMVRITNQSSDFSTVYISDSVLRRELAPKGHVYALQKSGRYLSFLPRFFAVGDTLLLLENGRLCTLWNGDTAYFDTETKTPACWCHCNEYGTFIIDCDGQLDGANAWPESMPSKPVVSVSAFGMDYCMLLEDGSVNSRLPKEGWDKLIYAACGLNAGIAIDSQRIPILQDGRKLPYKEIIEAYALENHYICLSSKGQVKTDGNLKAQGTIWAVAICQQGYVLAGEGGLMLVDFQNHVLRTWREIISREIVAAGKMIAYYDADHDQVRQIKL